MNEVRVRDFPFDVPDTLHNISHETETLLRSVYQKGAVIFHCKDTVISRVVMDELRKFENTGQIGIYDDGRSDEAYVIVKIDGIEIFQF